MLGFLFQLVAPTGFEPAISALRGRRPKPLDDGAMLAGVEGVEPSHTVPETAVLPLDDEAICRTREYLCHFKLQVNNFFKKTVPPETIFRLHFRQFSITLNSAVRKSPAVRTGKRFGVVTDLDNNGLDIVR